MKTKQKKPIRHTAKLCIICNDEYKSSGKLDLRCSTCAKIMKINPEKERIYQDCLSRRDLCRRYDLSFWQYVEMTLAQKGLCAICHRSQRNNKPLAIDHDHKTGKVRGLLCTQCNTSLGGFRDSIGWLANAAIYLKRHQSADIDIDEMVTWWNRETVPSVPTEMAEIAKEALKASGSSLFSDVEHLLSSAEQNEWLNAFAEHFLSIATKVQDDLRASGHIREYLREQGYKLDDADIFILEVRFERAGYLSSV